MPVKSKAQLRFMEAAAHGNVKSKGAPSKAQAKEYLSAGVPKNLPDRISKDKVPVGRKPLGKTKAGKK